jgi:hypothetical protein
VPDGLTLHRERWAMPFGHGSATPRPADRRPALPSQFDAGWPVLSAAPVDLEGTLTAMTLEAAALIVRGRLDAQLTLGDLSPPLSLPRPTILS